MNRSIFRRIFQKHSKILKNLNNKKYEDKKLVICFSGVPASGKTTLAKILEKRYKAVRINKDKIGEIINSLSLPKDTEDKESITDQYIFNLLENYPFKNKLIILDRSLDREYKKIFKILKKSKFNRFVVRLKVSKKQAIKRIKKRNKNYPIWLKKIDKWFRDFEESGKSFNSDVEISSNLAIQKNLKCVFSKIDRALTRD